MKLLPLKHKLSAFLVTGYMTLVQGLAAEGNSSLSESKIENGDAKLSATAGVSENEQLRAKLALAQESIKKLTDALVASNVDGETYRRKYSELLLRVEALGLESGAKDRTKLEQRLLNAVSDLRLMQKEREQYRDQMLGLSEAVLAFLKTSSGGEAQARMAVEVQLRRSNELATKSGKNSGDAMTLMDGRVISVKEDWSLVVGNMGEKQGVKMGMPLQVMRGDQVIARLRVIDVRNKICGAMVQEMGSEKIKVGDRLRAEVQQKVSLK